MRRILLTTAVVVVNAAVQAALVMPGVSVAASPAFLGLLAASTVTMLAAAVALVILSGAGGRPRVGRVVAAVVVAATVVVALAVLSTATLVPSVLVALVVVSPLGSQGAGPNSGPRCFVRHPVRAVLLAMATVIAVVLIGVAALLLGFLVTGWLGAFATWAVGGALVAVLVRAWARLAARRRPTDQPLARVRPDAVAR